MTFVLCIHQCVEINMFKLISLSDVKKNCYNTNLSETDVNISLIIFATGTEPDKLKVNCELQMLASTVTINPQEAYINH